MRAHPSPSPWAGSAASSRWRWPRGGCRRYGGRRSGGSQQPSQFQRHADGIRLAAQHEQAHHAVGAQRLACVAQVALRHAASVDEEELVAHRDPGLCAGAARYDIIDHDVLQPRAPGGEPQSEEHTSELQSRLQLVCRLLLEKKKQKTIIFLIFKKKNNINKKKV